MKLVQINATCGVGSTGKICTAISELLDKRNIENYIFYVQSNSDAPHGKKYMSFLVMLSYRHLDRVFLAIMVLTHIMPQKNY